MLKEGEILVTSSIIGLGAVRQARSHCKACIQLGIDLNLVQTIVQVARELALWNGSPLTGEIDVPLLAIEVEQNLAKEPSQIEGPRS